MTDTGSSNGPEGRTRGAGTTTATDASRGFFGQPRSLANIFGVEMWERFSFYGMQGILLIYLYYSAEQGGLGIDQATAAGIVGAYGGAVYLSTILGAWLADRLFGSERVLFWSAVVIMAGHIALALLPSYAGVIVGLLGLLFVAVGSGGLKANATRIVGTLYDEHDSRRDAGFSLFYLGINLGAFFGPLLTGLLQSTLGFHWGFGLAAVGMAIGLIQYSLGRKRLPDAAREVPNPLPAGRYPLVIGIGVVGIIVIVALVLSGAINAINLALWVIGITIVAAIAYFVVILGSRPSRCSSPTRRSGRCTSSSSRSSRSTRTSGSIATSSAGSSRSRGCNPSIRSSSSSSRASSSRSGRSGATSSRRRR